MTNLLSDCLFFTEWFLITSGVIIVLFQRSGLWGGDYLYRFIWQSLVSRKER
ncbi:hypothetical protein [Persicobacter diffluens]|uniref:Uncharacterized protein n=1 Tax=Persicobacter diffluens TaxID=981 RepID=A0AAN4W4E0_9BACT|nr:hypothetical protein PEDI_43970 [Persicobacter diffluens]